MAKNKYDIGQLRGAYGAGFGKGVIEGSVESKNNPILTGRYFIDKLGKGYVGYVKKRIDVDTYQVALLSGILPGTYSNDAVLNYDEMKDYEFFSSQIEFRDVYWVWIESMWENGASK